MTIYLTCASLFSIYIEVNYILGKSPLFLKEKYKAETIIHLPFTLIIFTPYHKLIGKTDDQDEKRNTKIHKTSARTAKN